VSDTNYSSLPEQLPEPGPDLPDLDIRIEPGEDDRTTIDPATGAVQIEQPDGSVVIDLAGRRAEREKTGSSDHAANLADHVDPMELSRVAEELLQGIESDEQSRSTWLENRAKGIGLLALQLDEPKANADGGAISVVRSPLLLEGVLRFQANAIAELLPSAGPVKVRNDTVAKTEAQKQREAASGEPPQKDEGDVQAKALEDELNHFLTTTAREYYPDTRRMFFYTGFGGSAFKKVYRCPLRRRPVSESIDAKDLIVSDAAVDLHNAGRVTHQSKMRQSVMKRMQIDGQYRDVVLTTPAPASANPVEQKEGEVTGLVPSVALSADHQHHIFECYCELDLKGFEHKKGGVLTGLPLPYRVTMEKDSRQVLEIRRNWKEGDDRYQLRMPIVKYSFVEGLGFYGIGLLHILGNPTTAVTAAWRMALDAGMFASFPGFLQSDATGRQDHNNFRIAPGTAKKINTAGMPITDAVMPVPYRDASPGLMAMMQHIEENAGRVGGVAELSVGEGRQDAPVGTTLAMLDQATKIMAGVHKGLHQAQSEEFQLLRDLFIEDPEPLLCGNREWEREQIVAALENCNLVPAADPNTPSHMHRIIKAQAIKGLQQANPQLYDAMAVDKDILHSIGVSDPDSLFAPPQPPGPLPPDPMMMMVELQAETERGKQAVQMAKLQADAKSTEAELQLELMKLEQDSRDKALDRESRERIASFKERIERLQLAQSALQHADSIPAAQGYAGNPKKQAI
jgi:hypothetical protein